MTRLRIGVVGLGAIAQIHHLPALELLSEDFELCHVCDFSAQAAENLGKRYGAARCSTDWRAVCSDPCLDAVLLLHSGSHGPQARMALEHGHHVLAEKPLCYTIREADELDTLARRAGLVLQVGYMKSHEAVMQEARAAVQSLGELRLVRHAVLHPSETAQQEHLRLRRYADADPTLLEEARGHDRSLVREAIGEAPPGLSWLYEQLALGSIVHYLAVFRSLFGSLPERIDAAHAWPFDVHTAPAGWGPDDQLPTLGIYASFDNGCRVALEWSWLQRYPEYTETIEVLSADGGVRVSLPPPYLHHRSATLTVDRLESGRPSRRVVEGGYDVAFTRELRHFHHAIMTRAVSLDAGYARADAIWCQRMTAAVAARFGVSLDAEQPIRAVAD